MCWCATTYSKECDPAAHGACWSLGVLRADHLRTHTERAASVICAGRSVIGVTSEMRQQSLKPIALLNVRGMVTSAKDRYTEAGGGHRGKTNDVRLFTVPRGSDLCTRKGFCTDGRTQGAKTRRLPTPLDCTKMSWKRTSTRSPANSEARDWNIWPWSVILCTNVAFRQEATETNFPLCLSLFATLHHNPAKAVSTCGQLDDKSMSLQARS